MRSAIAPEGSRDVLRSRTACPSGGSARRAPLGQAPGSSATDGSPEARIPASHPLRKTRELVREVLGELNHRLGKLYASEGRPSIPPEQLLSALLLQVFYGIRSERQLMEQLDYNLLYRWFVG